MFRTGAVSPLAITPWVAGDTLTVAVNSDQVVTGLNLDGLLYQVMRHRVIMLVILDVIIDMDAGLLDLGVLVRLRRQGPQDWFIQLLELTQSRAGQFFKRPLIKVIQ